MSNRKTTGLQNPGVMNEAHVSREGDGQSHDARRLKVALDADLHATMMEMDSEYAEARCDNR